METATKMFLVWGELQEKEVHTGSFECTELSENYKVLNRSIPRNLPPWFPREYIPKPIIKGERQPENMIFGVGLSEMEAMKRFVENLSRVRESLEVQYKKGLVLIDNMHE